MIIKEHKIQIPALFAATFILFLLSAISFWNKGRDAEVIFGIWPMVFLLLSLISGLILLFVYLRITNPEKLNLLIQEKVTVERQRILSEFDKKEDIETTKEQESDIAAEKIVPSGSYKTTEAFAKKLLLNLSKYAQASIGVYYDFDSKSKAYRYLTGFALPANNIPQPFKSGENLNGQVAKSKQIMTLNNIPENYFNIESGLGKNKPCNILIAPIVNNNKTIAIIEIATFIKTSEHLVKLLNDVCILSAKKLVQIEKSSDR